MGKFKAGLKASQEAVPENQNAEESKDQKTSIPESQYSDDDMKPVNVGGFKVPRAVREHWMIEAKRARTPISRMFRELLIEKFGLPEGITEEDL